MYHYFVAYTWSKKPSHGVGRMVITMNERISRPEHINALENSIRDKERADNVVVLNFILLSEEAPNHVTAKDISKLQP